MKIKDLFLFDAAVQFIQHLNLEHMIAVWDRSIAYFRHFRLVESVAHIIDALKFNGNKWISQGIA